MKKTQPFKKVKVQYSLTQILSKKTLRVWITKKGKRIELNPNQFVINGTTLELKNLNGKNIQMRQ